MNKTNSSVFAAYHSELVENWYPGWISSVRRLIPYDMAVSDAEIDSEITAQCIYLASIFRGGSFPAYCNEYVVRRAAAVFRREYRALDHGLIAEAYEEYEDDYESAYVQKRQYGTYDIDEQTPAGEYIEIRNLVECAMKSAKDDIEKRVLELILDGFTYE